MKIFCKKIWPAITNFFSLEKSKSKKNSALESAKMRKNMSEKKVDKMIKDSFPASDPPSTY